MSLFAPLRTFARVENGQEAEQVVLRDGQDLPKGDWRPVVVEGLDFDRARLREIGRETRIDPDKVARIVITEPMPQPTREDYANAVEAHVDAVARAQGYSSTLSMISYLDSSVPLYASQAAAMRAWRDSVWQSVAAAEQAAMAGERPVPAVAALIGELPPHPFK